MPAKPSQPPPVPLVRYCFDPTANVELHFHELDERSLFFYPSTVAQKDGQWIFAELRIEGSGVPCLLRGRVNVCRSMLPSTFAVQTERRRCPAFPMSAPRECDCPDCRSC